MGEEPERGEVGVQVLREDPVQVRLDPRRPRQTLVVTRDPQREAVRREAPECRVGGVQHFLQEPERGSAAVVVSQQAQGGVQAPFHRGHHDGHTVTEGEEANRIHPVADGPWRRWREGREPERVAEQLLHEALRKRARVAFRGATRFQVLEARLGDAPAARDLVADFEAPRDAVVVRLLGRGPELSHLAEPVGADDTALDRQGIERQPSPARTVTPRPRRR
ncbi:MAG: hypothetical protein OXQ31_14025 [Spirochaetaceae bacterium]|nr:hypothetical protein [Spirochaetaceae bacterium]